MTTNDTTNLDPYADLSARHYEMVTAVSYLPADNPLADYYTIRVTWVPADGTYQVTDPAGATVVTACNRSDAITTARRHAAALTVDGSTALDVLANRARAKLTKAQRAVLLDVANPEVRVFRADSYRSASGQYYRRPSGAEKSTKASAVSALITADLVRVNRVGGTRYTDDVVLTSIGRAVVEALL